MSHQGVDKIYGGSDVVLYSFSLIFKKKKLKCLFMKVEVEGIIGSEIALKSAHSHLSS